MKRKYNIWCEFGLKITPINLDVWSKMEGMINIKVISSNNNSGPRSNPRTKCKVQNHKHKIKREEEQTHQEILYIDLSNLLSMSSL
jgi:hypothetical protein